MFKVFIMEMFQNMYWLTDCFLTDSTDWTKTEL